jgi:hypothetical protein
MKTMLISFFDSKGTVYCECISQAKQRLLEAVHRKKPEVWPHDWILHHDNASAHKTLSVKQFLVQKSIIETEHISYAPDLALNELFPKINEVCLKGTKISGY